jgi:hypothetical protein
VARVDESPVQRWWICDPEHPQRPPAQVSYPAAGTPNALVRLLVLGLDGSRPLRDVISAARTDRPEEELEAIALRVVLQMFELGFLLRSARS